MAAHAGAGTGTGTQPGFSSGRLPDDQVREMFERIAGLYDVMNTAMTVGLHHRWRARAADLAGVGPGARVLDVATGTGDLALELARRVHPGGEVVGIDFAEAMLARANEKAAAVAQGGVRPRFELGDALALPFAADSFDAAGAGFGVRNFSDLRRGLGEMARVVRPGGRVVVLEITTPMRAPLSHFYALWFDRLVPALGRLAARMAAARSRATSAPGQSAIADAYTYLPSSVRRFPDAEAMAGEMRAAGLRDVAYELLAGGIVAIHVGVAGGPEG
jgi:demethylmenaquinone methyltransferase/2-methoxy-6-polyprenyl-1,4-benzoquinol methylase